MATKVALVTGASSGIGASAARKLHDLGYVVYGAARRVDRMKDLADAGIEVLGMDVTDQESMAEGVRRILDAHGRIDVLVNNAGYGSYGAVEDVPLAEARSQFEVNVFGAAALIQLVTPHMRAQGSGRIINITSMGGKITTPFGGWYHGTKFALEALSDSLRSELRPFGIDVVVIEPGGIRTEWGGIAADNLAKTSGEGAYAKPVARMARQLGREGFGSDPKVIASAIARASTARRPRTRYAVGFGAKPGIFLHWLLPDRAWDGLLRLGIA
ncbi:MAG TPA: oxidoreductase [Pseudonocardiaceae bacterium]|jgi:NAD(P)-dependent dehydrogenase (short-subunit alcohol dehydrogenase family)